MNNDTVSIIIPCLNQLIFTKKCVYSVVKSTKMPFELIFVDNGSTDGTSCYLNEVKKKYPVKIIKNSCNKGAPAAFNQGIKSASSEHIMLLNNDTIVTDSWASKMVDKIQSVPHAGIVGPCANPLKNAKGTFPMQDAYKSFKNIQRTAAFTELSRKNLTVSVPGLTSYCMLIKKEVLDRIGLFDENYGLGTNDDHDFCLRVRLEGYKIICALDVLVFHFYSRTLEGLDICSLDRRNREYFAWKFGKTALRYLKQVNQPYGTRGERSFADISEALNFPEPPATRI